MKLSRKENGIHPGRGLAMVLLLLMGSSTSAVAEGAFDGGDPVVVPAVAFNLDGFAGTDYFFNFGSGALHQTVGGFACFMAPLYLPDEKQIALVRLSAVDTNASLDLSVSMVRYNFLTGGSREFMATAGTSGSSGFQLPEDRTIDFFTINNDAFKYDLEFCVNGDAGSSLRVFAVTVGSELFSDGFESGSSSAWTLTVP